MMRAVAEHQGRTNLALGVEVPGLAERPAVAQRRHGRDHENRTRGNRLAGDGRGLRSVAELAGKQRRIEPRRLEQDLPQGLAIGVAPARRRDGLGVRRQALALQLLHHFLVLLLSRLGGADGALQQAAALQLLDHLAGGQRVGRNHARHDTDDHGADQLVREPSATRQPVRDEAVDERDDRARSLVRRACPLDGAIDQVAHAHGAVQRQPARRFAAQRIGEQQRGNRHAAVEEGIRLIDVEAEIVAARFGEDPSQEVPHDVDAAARTLDQRLGDISGAVEQVVRILALEQRVQDIALHLVFIAVQPQREGLAARDRLHLGTERHGKVLRVVQHPDHVGMACHDHQPADAGDRPHRAQHREGEQEEPSREPPNGPRQDAVRPQRLNVEGRQGLRIGRPPSRLPRRRRSWRNI